MTKEFVRYLRMCVDFHHENDESFKITDSANAKENLMYLKAIHYINKLYSDVEENYTIEQNAGENRIEGGVVSISGSVDTFRCWKCGRTLPISEKTGSVYMSNPPKYACKDCEGINKEKQYRPFKDCNELIEHYQKKYKSAVGCDIYFPSLYKPCIWVKSKEYGTDFMITAFDNNNESIGANVIINDMGVTMKMLFDNYIFCDNSVCGMEE